MNNMTLAAVAAVANQSEPWVNGPFEAIVRNAKGGGAGQGGKQKPSKCVLCDPNDPNVVLNASWFGGNFLKYEEKIILVTGKGTKCTMYNGSPEVSIGKDATVAAIGEAPRGGPAPSGDADQPPRADEPKKSAVDPVTYFHREMAKLGLGYSHAYQYALNVKKNLSELGVQWTPEQLQACVGSLFIQANMNGLLGRVPKLRDVDADRIPLKFIPPEPDLAAQERERQARAEAERLRLEAERKAKAALPPQQENLDEDVPF